MADSLRFTSAISVLLAVVFMCISTGMALYALFQGATETPRLLPDFGHMSSIFELFTAVPIIVVAFTFHFNGKTNLLLLLCAHTSNSCTASPFQMLIRCICRELLI